MMQERPAAKAAIGSWPVTDERLRVSVWVGNEQILHSFAAGLGGEADAGLALVRFAVGSLPEKLRVEHRRFCSSVTAFATATGHYSGKAKQNMHVPARTSL